MSVKLIALDLDGTTLNSRGHLSQGNREALEEAISQGINVVIATGRCYRALPSEVTNISGIQYAITSNGAQIRDLQSGRSIYNNCLDPSAAMQSAKVLRQYEDWDVMMEVFVDGTAYMEEQIYEEVKAGRNSNRSRDYVVSTRNPQMGLMDFLERHREEIENINIFFESLEDKKAMRPALETIDHVTLTTSFDNNWEIGGETTSKAAALAELGHILGVDRAEILACGDSPNDEDMLREAGIPVAVGNAKPEIKRMATYISGTNDQDGVAEAVRRFALRKNIL